MREPFPGTPDARALGCHCPEQMWAPTALPFQVNVLCRVHGASLSPQSIKDGLRTQAREKIARDPVYIQGETRLSYLFVNMLTPELTSQALVVTRDMLCVPVFVVSQDNRDVQAEAQQWSMMLRVEGTLPLVTDVLFWGSLDLVIQTEVGPLVSMMAQTTTERGTYYSADDLLSMGRAVRHTRRWQPTRPQRPISRVIDHEVPVAARHYGLGPLPARRASLRFVLAYAPTVSVEQWAVIERLFSDSGMELGTNRMTELHAGLVEWQVEVQVRATAMLGHQDVRDILERQLTQAIGVNVRLVEYVVHSEEANNICPHGAGPMTHCDSCAAGWNPPLHDNPTILGVEQPDRQINQPHTNISFD